MQVKGHEKKKKRLIRKQWFRGAVSVVFVGVTVMLRLTTVCANCGSMRNESYATVMYVSGTLTLDLASYKCDGGYTGSPHSVVICSAHFGSWNHSAIDCHDEKNILHPNSTVLDPQPENSTDDPNNANDGDPESYVTMTLGSSLIFNISQDAGRMEVSSVNLTLQVNSSDDFPPCQLTSHGSEYSGREAIARGTECQRWDSQYPNQHNFTDDDLFPADGSVEKAENYCRNPNNSMARPWCFTTDPEQPGPQICTVLACVRLKIVTVYIDMNGEKQTDTCSPLKDKATIYPLLNLVNGTRTLTIGCRNNAYSSRILPFGHQLRIDLMEMEVNVTVNIYDVTAFGRQYIGGCGSAKGYWKVEWVDDPPVDSDLASKVTYRCKSGFHYLGGLVESVCEDNRQWGRPDVSQCIDDPNQVMTVKSSAIGSTVQRTATPTVSVSDDDLKTFVKVNNTSNWTLTIPLKSKVEVADVVIIAGLGDSHSSAPHVSTKLSSTPERTWACKSPDETSTGYNRTFRFICPFRPVSDQVVVSYIEANDLLPWTIYEVKVFGLTFTTALECLQTETGQEYKGQWSLTSSGRECQRWDSSSPHSHMYTSQAFFPDPSIEMAGNYCRNPSRGQDPIKLRPWCFTTDSEKEWEYCPLFLCDEICRVREDGVNYQGSIAKTSSGKSCQRWFDNMDWVTQFHFMREHYFPATPDDYLKSCRNPHGSQSLPWCFISRLPDEVISEFCDIPTCPTLRDTAWLYLEPDSGPSSIPAWLSDPNITVEECWQFSSQDFPYVKPERFESLSRVLQVACTPTLSDIGILCGVKMENRTIWHYFWYNCSLIIETTLLPTTETLLTTEGEKTLTLTTEYASPSTTKTVFLTTTPASLRSTTKEAEVTTEEAAMAPTTLESSSAVTSKKAAVAPTTLKSSSAVMTEKAAVASTTLEPSEAMPLLCDCFRACGIIISEQEVRQAVLQIQKDLLVDKSQLSATKRRKYSVEDWRPSAIITGTFGILVIVFFIGAIISSDVFTAMQTAWLPCKERPEAESNF